MKILFFKLGAIGDLLMTTPLLKQTRKNFPNSEIHYLAGKSSYKILKGNKNLNKLLIFDDSIFTNKKIIKWFKLISKIKKQKYDLVFILDRHPIFKLTAKLAQIKKRIGFSRLGKENKFLTKKVNYLQKKHDVLAYLDLLNTIKPVNYKDTKLDIFTKKQDKEFSNKFWKKNKLKNKKVIVICPGGGQNIGQTLLKKVWPTQNFIKLIKILKKKYKIILIGGPRDKEIENKILSKEKVLSLIGKTSLQESAEIMRKANLIITNDSGPMHMASAINNKIISLFGPTDPRVLAPLNKGSKYIWKLKKPIYDTYGKITNKDLNPIKAIGVNDVLDTIFKNKRVIA